MDTALFVGLAHKKALKRRMDVVANNIANMSTTAYKKERVAFQEYLMDAKGAAATTGGKISFVQDYGIIRNLQQGQMIPTSNPLDVFINGKGYLSVGGQGGETLYTRNGRMMIDNENFLAVNTGERLLDVTGQTIFIPNDQGELHIAEDGTLSNESGDIGQLALATFQNEQQMKRRGNSLYESAENPIPPEDTIAVSLKTRAIESSNVNSIESMMEMIKVQRAYQSASRQSRSYEEMREDSLDRLARVQ